MRAGLAHRLIFLIDPPLAHATFLGLLLPLKLKCRRQTVACGYTRTWQSDLYSSPWEIGADRLDPVFKVKAASPVTGIGWRCGTLIGDNGAMIDRRKLDGRC
jgi:hypothetical protein